MRYAFVILAVLGMVCASGPVHGQSAAPGSTEPLKNPGNYLLFRNDNFFLAGQPAAGQDSAGRSTVGYRTLKGAANPSDSTLTGFSVTSLPLASQPQGEQANGRIAVGAGRILAPDADQGVVFRLVDFIPDSSNVQMGMARYQVQIFDASGNVLFVYALPYVHASLSSHLAVAVGDLDRLYNADQEYQDEVVLVSESGTQTMQLTVISFLNGVTKPTITSIDTGIAVAYWVDPPYGCSVCDQADRAGQISVTVGDFDADGVMEIATSVVSPGETFVGELALATYRYTNDGRGNVQLTQAYTNFDYANGFARRQPGVPALANKYAMLAAGDFNDDGRDEIMLGYPDAALDGSTTARVLSFAIDDKLQVGSLLGSIALGDATSHVTDVFGVNPKFADSGWVQIKAGLFKWDPLNGYTTRRRQLAVIFGNSFPVFGLVELPLNPDGTIRWVDNPGGGLNAGGGGPYDVSCCVGLGPQFFVGRQDSGVSIEYPDVREAYTITAGKFGGYDPQQPNWHFAILLPFLDPLPFSNLNYGLAVYKYSGGLSVPPVQVLPGLSYHRTTAFGNMAVAGLDLDGKSLRLGAPVHLTLDNIVRTDAMIQEPPKHVYYEPTTGEIVNVSRCDDFTVEMKDSTGTDFASTSTDTSSWNIGGSVAVSGGATISSGVDADLFVVKEQFDIDVTAKGSYDYNERKGSYNASYGSREVTITGRTDHDDWTQGRTQSIDIWRYRVFGATNPDPQAPNAFYDLVMPGPAQAFAQSASNADWYQPVHENGNLLSYPAVTISPFTPPDIGSFTIPCPIGVPNPSPPCHTDDNGANVQTLVGQPLSTISIGYGGTPTLYELNYSFGSGQGSSFSNEHTLSGSLDIKTSIKGDVDFPIGERGELRLSGDVELHSGGSWGKSKTSDNTTTQSKGITLNVPSGDLSRGYNFSSVFYTTQDGTIKVAHAVDVLGSATGREFWLSKYGGQPDPALNLPNRFSASTGQNTLCQIVWEPNTGSSRKHMRGFSLRKPQLNPKTNDFDLLGSSTVKAGDQVRVEANVYNYSTGVAVNDLLVSFQAIGYRSQDDTELPFATCPNNAPVTRGRCEIGHTTIPLINAWPDNVANAAIVWDTTLFGSAVPDAMADYRIYVVLDPNDAIVEKYDTEDPSKAYPCVNSDGNPCLNGTPLPPGLDPGQNNEGFGYVTVAHASVAATPLAALDADVSLRADAIAARDASGSIRTTDVSARVNQPLPLRFTVHSDRSHEAIGHLLVYDGDPAQGGQTIASKLVHTGNVNGASVWFDWTPRTAGEHHIFAKLLERTSDAQPGNNVAALTVSVTPEAVCAANVSKLVTVKPGGLRRNSATGRYVQEVTLTNVGSGAVVGPLSLVLDNLSPTATLFNGSGTTTCALPARPFTAVSVGTDNVLRSRESATVILEFTNPSNARITYSPRVLVGTP